MALCVIDLELPMASGQAKVRQPVERNSAEMAAKKIFPIVPPPDWQG